MKSLFNQLREYALLQPESIAIRSENQSLSYATLIHDVEQLSAQLEALNAKAIGLYIDNGIEWIVIDLACSLAGISIVPLPWFFSPQQLQHACNDAAIDYVVATHESKHGINHLITLNHSIAVYQQCFLHPVSRLTTSTEIARRNGGKVSYTSGTTGSPKGIWLENAFIEQTITSICSAIGELEINRHLSILPYATLLENIAGVYVPLMMGKTIYAEPASRIGLSSDLQLNPLALEQTFNQTQPESLIVTPQLLEVMILLAENQRINTDCLKFIAVGGARVTDTLIKRARQANIPAYEGYGLTEFGSVALLNTPLQDRIGSTGKALPGVNIEIANDGEIILSTKIRTENNASKLVKVATGDLGEIDRDGYVYIHGRKSNTLVLLTGRNVSPEWVESELNLSPLIQQCYVYGEGQVQLSALIGAQQNTSDHAIQTEIDRINESLPAYARIAHWKRLVQPFSVRSETLTPNGRLRRDNIQFSLPYLLSNLSHRNVHNYLPIAETNQC